MAQDVQQQRQPQPPASRGGCKLFLGGLSWETSEDKLKQYFGKYGDITEVVVMRDRNTNKPRGFGFITFTDDTVANRVCQDTHTIDGRTIDAKPSVPQGEGSRPRTRKVFVGGLAPETTEEQFKAHFEQFGKVVEAQIMQDYTSGRSRGFGFVTFEDEAAVEKVFAAGSMQELGGKRVEVKNATPKGSGPQSVRMATGGRGVFGPAVNAGRGVPAGRGYGEYMAPQYPGMFGMPGGYGMVPQYPGYGVPYGTYGSMVMPQMNYGGYGYPQYAYQAQSGGGPGYAPQAPLQPQAVGPPEAAAGTTRYSGQHQPPAQQPAPQRQQQPGGQRQPRGSQPTGPTAANPAQQR